MTSIIHSFLHTTEQPVIERPLMHSHDNYEIYCFLSGDINYLVEGKYYHLKKGDIMVMRKGELHINSILSNIPYKRITVNFEITDLLNDTGNLGLLDLFHDRELGEYNHYCAHDFPNNHWFQYLSAICNSQNTSEKICYLLPLLCDLNKCFISLKTMTLDHEANIPMQICKYINSNLSQNLSLEVLSKKFHISKTHLNRIFRASLGTTVGQYIKIKRLFWAKELLQKGESPMEVYFTCGFNDYTTFYRSFKKQFSLSPKEISPSFRITS